MHVGQFNLLGYRTRGTAAAGLYDGAVEQVTRRHRVRPAMTAASRSMPAVIWCSATTP
jgi:hypothetical protein